MLIEFSVGNFRSFDEIVTLSMLATNYKARARDESVNDNNVFEAPTGACLLNSAALYGANASGKSNLIKALSFMRGFVRKSSKESQSTDPIEVEPFRLRSVSEQRPSSFEVVFILDEKQYRYGFEVNTQCVVKEWLFHVPKSREAKLFEREGDRFSLGPSFKEGKGLEEKTRKNALFLSVVDQFNGAIAQKVVKWFGDIGFLSSPNFMNFPGITINLCLENNELRDTVIQFIKKVDVGIDGLSVDKEEITPDRLSKEAKELVGQGPIYIPLLQTRHRMYNDQGETDGEVIFEMSEHESDGTQKLFAIAGPILDTLKCGDIIIIDELDTHLHPLITKEIIQLFNSKETNPKGAQLIFTTHDTNLLQKELFRRDQIWFTEKNERGATDLYSLVEYKMEENKKVRNDASYESDYIKGRYGAIPFIGDLRRVVGAADE